LKEGAGTSPTRIAPTLADSPVDGVPAQDVAHHAPAPFDPQMIAGLANAFFKAPPASLASAPVPFGLPVATPNLPDAPAPSVVTTAAPFVPARAPLGPPDIPPTTIPSVRADAEHSGA
jgi:cysteine desulfurase/selenocysteine lyase